MQILNLSKICKLYLLVLLLASSEGIISTCIDLWVTMGNLQPAGETGKCRVAAFLGSLPQRVDVLAFGPVFCWKLFCDALGACCAYSNLTAFSLMLLELPLIVR